MSFRIAGRDDHSDYERTSRATLRCAATSLICGKVGRVFRLLLSILAWRMTLALEPRDGSVHKLVAGRLYMSAVRRYRERSCFRHDRKWVECLIEAASLIPGRFEDTTLYCRIGGGSTAAFPNREAASSMSHGSTLLVLLINHDGRKTK